MELDGLKDIWNKSTNQLPVNNNIMETIYSDSNSPLALLEKKLKITLGIFPLVVILFGGTFLSKSMAQQSPVTWLLFSIMCIEFLFSLGNYHIVKQIQQHNGTVRANLLGKITILQKRYKTYLFAHQGLYGLLAVLLEISMYKHWDANFNGWYTVNPVLRVAVYVVFLVVQYMLKKSSLKSHYGQYLEKLNSLAQQMG
jgi:hypothetical protein